MCQHFVHSQMIQKPRGNTWHCTRNETRLFASSVGGPRSPFVACCTKAELISDKLKLLVVKC